MATLPLRPLGSSGIPVSVMSLGSWRTFERISREQGEAVMRAARDEGINFLDDARYNDETGDAPIPSGYSEVVFGELFRASGWVRDEVIVANKLWWEFWPEQISGRRARGVPRADGTRPRRSDLRHAAARHAPSKRHGARGCRVGRRAHRVGDGAPVGGGDVVGAAARRGTRHRRRARRAAPGGESAGLQPRAAQGCRRCGDGRR